MYFMLYSPINVPLYPCITPHQPQNNVSSIQTAKEKTQTKQVVNITRQDLQKMSYSVSKRSWTQQEDQKLVHLLEKQNLSWSQVAHQMGDRTYKMCYSRYKRIKLQAKRVWTQKEDQQLKSLVQIFGQQWKHLPQYFTGRSSKQIRQRYLNTLRPDVTKQEWSIQEDMLLIDLINKHGTQWKKIEKQLPNRSQNQLKNRYFSRLLRIQNKKKQRILQGEGKN